MAAQKQLTYEEWIEQEARDWDRQTRQERFDRFYVCTPREAQEAWVAQGNRKFQEAANTGDDS